MATFSFVQDVEVIAVRRSYYNIEAGTLEEAKEKLKEFSETDLQTLGNLEPYGVQYIDEKVFEDDTRDYLGFVGDYPDVFTYTEDGTQV